MYSYPLLGGGGYDQAAAKQQVKGISVADEEQILLIQTFLSSRSPEAQILSLDEGNLKVLKQVYLNSNLQQNENSLYKGNWETKTWC